MNRAQQSLEEAIDFAPDDDEPKDPPINWQSPVLFGNITTPDISPAKVLPPCLAEYVQAVAAATQTPPAMAVMLVLSVLATCLQKRFEVSPYSDDYQEPLSLWTITALPPASRKTAVITALTQPLSEWEKEQALKLRKQIAQRQAERSVIEKRIDGLEKQAAKTDDSEERQRLTVLVAELKEMLPDEIIAPRLWTGNITPERLQGLMVEHGGRMAEISDEGGCFEVMSGLYSDGKADIDIFLQAHAGSAVRVDRNSREAHIDKPALTFGLAVQPSVICDLSQGSKKRFRGTGALARFLYCIPKSNIGTRDVAKRQPIEASLKAAYVEKVRNLLDIPATADDTGKETPRLLTLNEEAKAVWIQFSQYIEANQGEGRELEPIQDWTGKLPGAALRIAGLCHVAEYGQYNAVINLATMERALDLCQLLIIHAQAAF